MNEIAIRVYGSPAPQGSKRFMGRGKSGKGIMVESSKAVRPWREAVKHAALDAMEAGELSVEKHCNGAMPGAVEVCMTFTVPKPKSAPKNRRVWPDKKPDLSKLVRSTEDALTDAGIWEDDSRVVSCRSRKVYPNEGVDSLHIPGAVIRIREAVE